MSITSSIRRGEEVGVFTRNHRSYLEEAVAISSRDPNERITFRARKKWVSAAKVLDQRTPLPLYVAPVGGDGRVEFVADLHEVKIDPSRGASGGEELLRNAVSGTKSEGLWEGSGRPVRTLYVITNCRRVTKPFPFTSLLKVADDMPLDEGFRYSYALVYRQAGAAL